VTTQLQLINIIIIIIIIIISLNNSKTWTYCVLSVREELFFLLDEFHVSDG